MSAMGPTELTWQDKYLDNDYVYKPKDIDKLREFIKEKITERREKRKIDESINSRLEILDL